MPRTSFATDVDGYAFPNHWELSPGDWAQLQATLVEALPGMGRSGGALPAPLEGLTRFVRESLLARMHPGPVGLCGGMTFAAADAYHRASLPPRGAFADGPRNPGWESPAASALRGLLWTRLMDSLRRGVGGSTLLTMAAGLGPAGKLGGLGWVRQRSREAFAGIRAVIDAGRSCPIAIIGTTLNPMENHQVLVTGYDPGPWGPESCRLYVFEPNAPGAERTIDYDFSGAQQTRESAHERGYHILRGPLIGFFVADYAPAPPLSALTVTEPLSHDSSNTMLHAEIQNTGFGDTPPLRLWIRGSLGGQSLDPGGERVATPLKMGERRRISAPLPSPGAPGERRTELVVAVEPAPGRVVWRLVG